MPPYITECITCRCRYFSIDETRCLHASLDPTTGELWTRPMPAFTTMRITCAICDTEVDATAFTRILPI